MPNKKSRKTLSNEQSGNAEFFRTEINQRFPEKFRAACLMVQGTSSDAGKSVLVTALCRWLRRRGVSVAPFKPQNMTLNSVQTADGGEIGVAQAVQALACGLAPHTDMNPVLLKPNSDTGSTVIIQGRAVAAMNAKTYHAYKSTARQAVLESFWRLAAEYRVILVEGAGSPAEINLRENDIANMGFAESVDSPVILVADIDRGGVFAQLAGTLALLSPTERDRVAGLIINRFRGDKDLLEPGLRWLEEYTGKPVLGVLPYLRDLHLDAEDSLSQNNARLTWAGLREGAAVDYPALHETAAVDYPALREAAIERLADMVEEHLDMGILLKLLKI